MKVFKAYPTIYYSGGIALIAAHDEHEAQELLEREDEMSTSYGKIRYKEMEKLNYDSSEPCVIENKIYIE